MRVALKIGLGLLVVMVLAGGSGYLWLRNSPYWAASTRFSETVEPFCAVAAHFDTGLAQACAS